MNDLFNANDIPREQPTVAPLRLPPVQGVPAMQTTYPSEPKSGKNMLVAIGFVALVIILLLLPDKVEPTEKSREPRHTSSEDVLAGKFNKAEEIEWVNYEKTIYKGTQVVSFVIRCNSPMLGEFEIPVPKETYEILGDKGILPVRLTLNEKGDTQYYDNPRLHENWQALLKGE